MNTGVNRRGMTQTKAEALDGLKDQTTSVTACVDKNVRVRIYGETAVVTGLGVRSGTYKGTAYADVQVLWTDTFIRKDGRWQCVASQATLIAAQQK